MKNTMVTGYYDYLYDEYQYSRIGIGRGKLYVDKSPNDIQKFFCSDKICPFCGNMLKKVFLGIRSEPRGGDLYERGLVIECPNCKWWTYKFRFSEDTDLIDEVQSYYTDSRYYGIIKKYNIADKEIPIEILTSELKKKPEILFDINPYKLEELAKEILKGVYDCEVYHVGKTGDGGIDLIVLESDEPILVQVKRRENPHHVELVKGVREFVGTLFIEDKRKGIYISTAKSFSKGSKKIAKKLLDDRKLDYFELVDYSKLCYLIGNIEERKHWSKLVKYFYEKENASIYDNEKAIIDFEGE